MTINLYKTIAAYMRVGLVACLLTVFFACSPESNENVESEIEEEEEVGTKDIKVKKVGKVFYTIPSPLEMTSLIKKAGASYDKEIGNSVSNASNYVTNISMALNLGVYGADLSYASIFDQTQETLRYFAVAKKLADGIGISSAFGKSTLDRIEANINVRDSLISIISDSYWETDAYLKENKRSSTSALVITGGWVEGLYIATRLAARTSNNKEIVSRIGEQKLSLNNLIAMLNSYDAENIVTILNELTDLKQIYERVELTYYREEPSTNPDTKVTTINTTSKISISEAELSNITDKIASIRNNIIK
ncbi:MAG: hypothetical protein JKY33_08620 [Bacteroidia bacterium]|nr:hypothetical protein [Bacteroidia bacterium]